MIGEPGKGGKKTGSDVPFGRKDSRPEPGATKKIFSGMLNGILNAFEKNTQMNDDDGPCARQLTGVDSPKKENLDKPKPLIAVSIQMNDSLFLPF